MSQTYYNMTHLDDPDVQEQLLALNANQLLDWYFATRNAKDAYEQAMAERLKPMLDQQQLIEFLIQRKMQTEDVKTISTTAGRATVSVRKGFKVVDPAAFTSYVESNGLVHLLSMTIDKKAMDEFLADHGENEDLPVPGVERTESSSLRFTKAK